MSQIELKYRQTRQFFYKILETKIMWKWNNSKVETISYRIKTTEIMKEGKRKCPLS